MSNLEKIQKVMKSFQIVTMIVMVFSFVGIAFNSNAVFKTLDYAHRSLPAHKEQDTFIGKN